MTTTAANTIEARAAPFIERVENLLEQIESERGSYMARCKALREDIKDVYAEAKDADLPLKALKQIVKYRELERKQAALADEMEGEDGAYDYEMLVAALGDLAELPLGQAALDLNGKDDGDEEDLRPRFMREGQTDIEDAVDEAAGKGRKRKAKSKPAAADADDPAGESPEERAAIAEIDKAGSIGGAAATFQVQ